MFRRWRAKDVVFFSPPKQNKIRRWVPEKWQINAVMWLGVKVLLFQPHKRCLWWGVKSTAGLACCSLVFCTFTTLRAAITSLNLCCKGQLCHTFSAYLSVTTLWPWLCQLPPPALRSYSKSTHLLSRTGSLVRMHVVTGRPFGSQQVQTMLIKWSAPGRSKLSAAWLLLVVIWLKVPVPSKH